LSAGCWASESALFMHDILYYTISCCQEGNARARAAPGYYSLEVSPAD
jgi:hypothetical protein